MHYFTCWKDNLYSRCFASAKFLFSCSHFVTVLFSHTVQAKSQDDLWDLSVVQLRYTANWSLLWSVCGGEAKLFFKQKHLGFPLLKLKLACILSSLVNPHWVMRVPKEKHKLCTWQKHYTSLNCLVFTLFSYLAFNNFVKFISILSNFQSVSEENYTNILLVLLGFLQLSL